MLLKATVAAFALFATANTPALAQMSADNTMSSTNQTMHADHATVPAHHATMSADHAMKPMSKADKAMMAKCHKMTPAAMEKNAKCTKMMAMHPEGHM